MYKTISIQNNTYQNLNAIASRLDKPKSQVIDELVKGCIKSMEEKEKQQLKEHNAFVKQLANRIKLPKGTKINSTELDKQFSTLKDIDF